MNKPSRAIRTHGKKPNKRTRVLRIMTRKLARLEKEAANA